MKKVLLTIVFLFLCSDAMIAQDTLITKTGTIYTGKLIGISESSLKFIPEESLLKTPQLIELERVKKVTSKNGNILYEAKEKSLIKTDDIASETEQRLAAENYLKHSEKMISDKSPKITIYPYSGKKIQAVFVKYENDSLFYYDLNTKTESKMTLFKIKQILLQNGLSVFGGDSYKNRLQMSLTEDQQIALKEIEKAQKSHEDYSIEKTQKSHEDYSAESLTERSTVALERIALAQTYFMIYSIVVTLVSILLLIA